MQNTSQERQGDFPITPALPQAPFEHRQAGLEGPMERTATAGADKSVRDCLPTQPTRIGPQNSR